jgi:two-component system nitrogen regulation sensor histidine kinase NtrY
MEGVVWENGGHGVIRIRARHEGDTYRVDVMDNGKGLPRENRQRLLEPYMTTREKGTGLGLAIVKKIIEDHGGRLELHDAPADFHHGRGAMISMILPPAATAADARVQQRENEKVDNGV